VVPCDAITIPLMTLLPWQDGHSHSYSPARPLPLAQQEAAYYPGPSYRRGRRTNRRARGPHLLHRGVHTPLRQFQLRVNYRG
jgi:hypothetical protein